MVRVISQETFDAVVRENMDDLNMNPEEAVDDAREQFLAQGVDLTNIVVVVPGKGREEHAVLQALQNLRAKLPAASMPGVGQDICRQCDLVTEECRKGLAQRVLATKNEGYETLIGCANLDDPTIVLSATRALANLLEGNPDPMDEEGFRVLLRGLDSSDGAVITASLELGLSCCVRHEHNRQNFVNNGLLVHLDQLFDRQRVKVCRIWQALVQDDDIRVPFGHAHEHARIIVEEHQALRKLTKAMNDIPSGGQLVSFLSCMSSLTVRNEYCQAVVDEGGLKSALTLLMEPDQSRDVVRESLKLLKTLAGNDDVKVELKNSQGIPIVVNSISRHLSGKRECAAWCGVVSAICLRQPANAQEVMDNGGAHSLTQILKTHSDSQAVMTPCCSAIRNIVSRSRDLSADFIALDVETLLHDVRKKLPKTEDAVKSALRDLGLKVELKEQWTSGLVQQ